MKSDFKLRSFTVTWLNLIFFLILFFYVGYIELFLNTQSNFTGQSVLVNPIRPDILASVSKLQFKNRIGDYKLVKDNDQWFLKSPKVLPANATAINNVINALSTFTIQTIYQKEPINMESFSLNNPTIEIKLVTELNESLTVKLGLINPIDNTTYMTLNNSNKIYQISLFKDSFQNYELSNFIDANIFSTPIAKLTKFYLYQQKQTSPYNYLSKTNDVWESQKYKSISQDNTKKKLSEILAIKPHVIIDKKDEEIRTFLQNYLDYPLYKIIVIDDEDQKITYLISRVIKGLDSLKIESRTYFIMTASDRPHPYIVNKDVLEMFPIRYNDLKN